MRILLLLLALPHILTAARSVTVPLILEGNAPIVEVRVRNGRHQRMARFLVDAGGGALFIGSKVMAELDAKPSGPDIFENGELLAPLAGLAFDIQGFELDSKGVNVFGLPNSKWNMPRNAFEGMLPAKLLRKYRVMFDYPGRKFTLAMEHGQPGKGTPTPTAVAEQSGFPRIKAIINGKLSASSSIAERPSP